MYGKSVYSIWLEKYGKEEADLRQKMSNERRCKTIGEKNNGRK